MSQFINECPFCFRKVQVKDDGTCLACGKNVKLASSKDLEKTLVVVTKEDKLPLCCVVCGSPAPKLYRRKFTYEPTEYNKLPLGVICGIVLTGGLLFVAWPWIQRNLKKYHSQVYELAIPFCNNCQSEKEGYMPVSVEGREFHLRVHRDFKKALTAST